ncbi:hypothetical protein RZS08_52350, partial [Arthrospira platensis SPKY1]|nr:hypothetical protein [Arthrospira platensis SPKY1]
MRGKGEIGSSQKEDQRSLRPRQPLDQLLFVAPLLAVATERLLERDPTAVPRDDGPKEQSE